MTIEITGSLAGSVDAHTPESLEATMKHAFVVLPGGSEAKPAWEGRLMHADAAKSPVAAPLFLFAHGSGGISPAVMAFGRYIAACGWTFCAPDSFVLKDRLTYKSPVAKKDYERVHAMRSAELAFASEHLERVPGFDGRYVVAGTSEGGVAAARFSPPAWQPEVGRLILSWSCEDNYHVLTHRTNVPENVPVLNIMSAHDPYFSRENAYLDNEDAVGNASVTLARHPDAAIVLIPGAPHTLFALAQVRAGVKAFLGRFI